KSRQSTSSARISSPMRRSPDPARRSATLLEQVEQEARCRSTEIRSDARSSPSTKQDNCSFKARQSAPDGIMYQLARKQGRWLAGNIPFVYSPPSPLLASS